MYSKDAKSRFLLFFFLNMENTELKSSKYLNSKTLLFLILPFEAGIEIDINGSEDIEFGLEIVATLA